MAGTMVELLPLDYSDITTRMASREKRLAEALQREKWDEAYAMTKQQRDDHDLMLRWMRFNKRIPEALL